MKKIFVVLIMVFSLTGCVSVSPKKSIIDSFIKDDLKEILFTDGLNINNDVILALNLLKETYKYNMDDILLANETSTLEVVDYYKQRDIESVYVAYNMCLVYDFFDLDLTVLKDYFNSDFYYDEYSYSTIVRCLKMLGVNSTLKSDITTMLVDSFTDNSYNDADTIAMKIITLGLDAPDVALEMLCNYITSEGVLGWDNEANACSTAQTIIALLCLGEDLCCDYTYDNKSIEDIFLEFYNGEGFKNKLDDEYIDYFYASPQGFLATVALYICNHCTLELF